MKITDVRLVRDARVKSIKKKSRARMFENCKAGDILHFSIRFSSVGYSGRGTHAAYVTVLNTRTSEETCFSFNQAYMYDDILDLEEV